MRLFTSLLVAICIPAGAAEISSPIVGRWFSGSNLVGEHQPIVVTPTTFTWSQVCGERRYKIIQDVVVETIDDQTVQMKRLASYVPAGRYRLIAVELGPACPGGLREIQFALPINIPSYAWIKDFTGMAWIGTPQPAPRLPLEFAGYDVWGRERGSESPNKSLERTRER